MVIIKDFSILTLINLRIEKKINDHTALYLRGHVKDEDAFKYAKKLDEDIIVYYKRDDSEEIIFHGIIDSITVEKIRDNSYIEMKAYSYSYKEDREERVNMFQNIEMTYQEMVDALDMKDSTIAYIDKQKGNQKINTPMCQYEETNFQFLKRVASRENLPLIVEDVSNQRPYIWLGRKKGKKKAIGSCDFRIENSSISRTCSITTEEKVDIGDWIKIEEEEWYVVGLEVFLNKGILYFKCQLTMYDQYISETFENPKIAGKSMIVEVAHNVDPEKKGRLQVMFDGEKVSSNCFWFPYLTPYGGDQLGISFIPEKGDKVLVYFPTKKEEEAVIIGSLRKNGYDELEFPDVKRIKVDKDKEIIFAKDTIRIEGAKEKVLLELSSDCLKLENQHSLLKLEKDCIELTTKNASIKIQNDVEIKGNKIKLN
ncbi:phage baseplate assembly protein V [Clostridium formicaceticum]|uniref:Gp5/Type VI secretion system Vgr protein OB-fold domain-containing protein n=1 Tax=Clostridium formicaceticum TaxID=1497 RepID=A0AAC9WHK7_9CLOT|nr:phage baseplate assembly protein V [Clostridium formicaceticum]AOY74680.1 hypothetical protein BJL90_01145 [Clostridium formicaceticum]ARE89056.1 hypothetical protein CLFO_34620 [Clostridium formicaceticum]